ncbi:MAG: hypothetical protein LBS99_01450, partial [Clostridiales bacterium]|nr:hypothetical protein [Clostridiales bacterium]
MMKKTCIKLLALCCMAALVLPSVGGFTKAGFDAAAVTAENAISFEASYAVGSTVTLPAQILTEGGKSYPAAPVVIAPSGVTLRVSELTLNETGKYVVDYRAACDGQMLSKSYSFQSVGKLFSVGAAKSAAAYGNAMYGDYVVPRPGIVASIARKDSFRYNKIINLRELGTNPFIELFVTPETIGLSDAANVFVTLTDAYDPTNAVT